MIGLALEGGGVRGSYQAGAYIAMLECGIKIDGVCGTSIGALNASVIASGKGEMLPDIWRNLDMGEVFGFSKPFVTAINNKKIKLDILKVILKEITTILINRGIALEGLKQVIDKYLDVDTLMNSDIDFGLVTVKRKGLKPLYLWKKDMTKEKVKEYVLASAFLPFFKNEKLIDDNYYLDGGFYDTSPVNMLIEKGYKKIYLVKLHGFGIVRPYDKDTNVIVIESKRNIGTMLDLNPNRAEENIKMGYYDAIRVLKGYDGEKYIFKRKSEKFYKFINRKVSNKIYWRVKNFFNTKTYKETTIKAIEYIMEKENINYYEIYKVTRLLRNLKKYKKNHFIYNYIQKLKYFI